MNKVLVANRGEVALRIFRTCKRLGIKTVAVYSDIDRTSLYVSAADQTFHLPGKNAAETYLNKNLLLDITRACGADAIHPGYGFLAENTEFATDVINAGFTFVGPSPSTLKLAGEKDLARTIAINLGIPVAPGYNDTERQSREDLTEAANALGFPLLIKAALGGGGRGMRRVDSQNELSEAISSAIREAKSAFGESRLVLEKVIEPARHIEVQLIGDKFGNIIHLFERDCSVQRRHQKIIEEAPASNLSETIKERLFESAIKLGKEVELSNAATVEFLVPIEGIGNGDDFYFLEVNPRLQVEHPVTEAITGIDLVELQLRVARGEKLPFKQSELSTQGFAIQSRIYAEVAQRNFSPSTGAIKAFTVGNVSEASILRVDHSLARNSEVSTYYDSLLAKVIVWAPSRETAIKELLICLEKTVIGGVDSNLFLLISLLTSEEFKNCNWHTRLLDTDLNRFLARESIGQLIKLAAIAHHFSRGIHWQHGQGQSKNREDRANLDLPPYLRNLSKVKDGQVEINDRCHHISCTSRVLDSPVDVQIEIIGYCPENGQYTFNIDSELFSIIPRPFGETQGLFTVDYKNQNFPIFIENLPSQYRSISDSSVSALGFQFFLKEITSWEDKVISEKAKDFALRSPLPGTVSMLCASVGKKVEKGDILIVIESMKMEHSLVAAVSGNIEEIHVTTSQTVKEGDALLTITPL